jgi:PAS domain S-box-containing protein
MEAIPHFVDSFFSALADPACIVSREGGILRVNGTAVATFNRLKEGGRLDDLAQALRWPGLEKAFHHCLQKGKTTFRMLKAPSGKALFDVTCVPVILGSGDPEGVLIMVANVMGETMQEDRFRVLTRVFDSITEGVLTLDSEGRITGTNRSAVALLGVEEETLKHARFDEVLRFKHRKQREELWTAMRERERFELNADLYLPTARELPCSISIAPLEEAESSVEVFVVILKDRAAQIEMERNLIQMEKLNSLGKLVAGFAHELNNPLTSVIGFSQLMLTHEGDKKLLEEIGIIHSHALRCKKIIDNLLAFARKHVPEKKPVDVNEVINTTVELLRYQLERNRIQIETRLADALPPIKADSSQLQQVLVNLIENSRYELADGEIGGRLFIGTKRNGEWIDVVIRDNGPGIPQSMLNRIFDPFYTTKPSGEGTGLGLSLSYGIVQEHGGTLSARNSEEGGAEFSMRLPLSYLRESLPPDLAGAGEGIDVGELEPGKKVLVIDDEKQVCLLISTLLTERGIEVDSAGTGEEALSKLTSGIYDLILLDIRLPDVNGIELKEMITRQWPVYGDRILFMTGDAVQQKESGFCALPKEAGEVIAKPFNLQSFERTVTEALGAK